MGQEQSSNARQLGAGEAGTHNDDGGVQRVHGSGAALAGGDKKDAVDELMEKSSALSLPQQLLPPPPVKDDMSSALQGAQMMHELRSALGGLLLGIEESRGLRTNTLSDPTQGRQSETEGTLEVQSVEAEAKVADPEMGGDHDKRVSHIDEFAKLAEVDPRAEQERWARLGIDQASVHAIFEECSGGTFMTSILDKQSALNQLITVVKEKSTRLRKAMDRNSEEARRTTNALEKLDRIHVALADIQENLESAVATANILGASHFAHDDEMCSFKNFLRHNPPKLP